MARQKSTDRNWQNSAAANACASGKREKWTCTAQQDVLDQQGIVACTHSCATVPAQGPTVSIAFLTHSSGEGRYRSKLMRKARRQATRMEGCKPHELQMVWNGSVSLAKKA